MIQVPISLLVAHFIGDAVLQSNKMALNKSQDTFEGLGWLSVHAFIYAMCFLPWGFQFFLITLITHWWTDYFTSRVGKGLWFVSAKDNQLIFDESKRHWFFVWLLFDQLIHFVTLGLTLWWVA